MNIQRSFGRGAWGILAAGLVGMLALSQGLQAAGKRVGAKVGVATDRDAPSFIGELIGVRADAIVIEMEPEEVLTIAIADISTLRVYHRSAAVPGGVVGALAGGAVAYAISSARYRGKLFGGLGIAGYSLLGMVGGGVSGALIGGIAGADKTYYLKNMTKPGIDRVMAKLRKKARVPKYQ